MTGFWTMTHTVLMMLLAEFTLTSIHCWFNAKTMSSAAGTRFTTQCMVHYTHCEVCDSYFYCLAHIFFCHLLPVRSVMELVLSICILLFVFSVALFWTDPLFLTPSALLITRNTFCGTRYLSHCHAIAVAFQHITLFTRKSSYCFSDS